MESDQFLLGFIAGEGSFFVGLYQRGSGSVEARPKFALSVDERLIVEQSKDKLNGIGQIIEERDGMITWQVQSIGDVQKMREWAEQNYSEWFDHTHKSYQFELWCEAVDIRTSEGMTNDDKKRLVDISYDIPRSNTKQLSREEWYQRIDNWEQYYCEATTEDSGKCQRPVPNTDDVCHIHE